MWCLGPNPYSGSALCVTEPFHGNRAIGEIFCPTRHSILGQLSEAVEVFMYFIRQGTGWGSVLDHLNFAFSCALTSPVDVCANGFVNSGLLNVPALVDWRNTGLAIRVFTVFALILPVLKRAQWYSLSLCDLSVVAVLYSSTG